MFLDDKLLAPPEMVFEAATVDHPLVVAPHHCIGKVGCVQHRHVERGREGVAAVLVRVRHHVRVCEVQVDVAARRNVEPVGVDYHQWLFRVSAVREPVRCDARGLAFGYCVRECLSFRAGLPEQAQPVVWGPRLRAEGVREEQRARLVTALPAGGAAEVHSAVIVGELRRRDAGRGKARIRAGHERRIHQRVGGFCWPERLRRPVDGEARVVVPLVLVIRFELCRRPKRPQAAHRRRVELSDVQMDRGAPRLRPIVRQRRRQPRPRVPRVEPRRLGQAPRYAKLVHVPRPDAQIPMLRKRAWRAQVEIGPAHRGARVHKPLGRAPALRPTAAPWRRRVYEHLVHGAGIFDVAHLVGRLAAVDGVQRVDAAAVRLLARVVPHRQVEPTAGGVERTLPRFHAAAVGPRAVGKLLVGPSDDRPAHHVARVA